MASGRLGPSFVGESTTVHRGAPSAARTLGRALLALCGSEGVDVSEDDAELDGHSFGVNGVYLLREGRIIVRSTLSADGGAKTLAHELEHHLLHQDWDASEADRPTFEAKGTVYAVVSYFGVDASRYSFAYVVARWAECKEAVRTALSSLQAVVRTIVGAVGDVNPQDDGATKSEAA